MKIHCDFCGRINEFADGNKDCSCGMKCRSDKLYSAVKNKLTNYSTVFEPQTHGKIWELLHDTPNYICSAYIDGVESGTILDGIMIQDLHQTSFSDSSVDIIILQDILEHVIDYECVLLELHRILKVGGSLFISIPIHKHKTRRVAIYDCDELVYIDPPEYHDDFGTVQSSLVFTKFGNDILYEFEDLFGKVEVIPFEFSEYLLFEVIKC